MAEIINFGTWGDPEEMDKETLLSYLRDLRALVAELDAAEPADMESEAYEAWGEQHEELEDLIDEALDLLDEMD